MRPPILLSYSYLLAFPSHLWLVEMRYAVAALHLAGLSLSTPSGRLQQQDDCCSSAAFSDSLTLAARSRCLTSGRRAVW